MHAHHEVHLEIEEKVGTYMSLLNKAERHGGCETQDR